MATLIQDEWAAVPEEVARHVALRQLSRVTRQRVTLQRAVVGDGMPAEGSPQADLAQVERGLTAEVLRT